MYRKKMVFVWILVFLLAAAAVCFLLAGEKEAEPEGTLIRAVSGGERL